LLLLCLATLAVLLPVPHWPRVLARFHGVLSSELCALVLLAFLATAAPPPVVAPGRRWLRAALPGPLLRRVCVMPHLRLAPWLLF